MMRICEQKAMKSSFLKFLVPKKTKTGITLSLKLSAFSDLVLILFSTLKDILEYEINISKRLYFQFLYIDALFNHVASARTYGP